jgi:DNA-binding TFAR19-related protein (PDSD5 family)
MESELRMTLMRLAEVTEQRDRLAEAVNAATILIAAKGRHNTMLAYEGLRDALQSLNQPTQ